MKTLLANFDDRINPIVIKELRQGVNGRFIAALLILFLLISVIVMGIFLAVAENEGGIGSDHGQNALAVMNGILLVTCLLFLPTLAAARLAGEWSDTNTDLLFISTIRPRAIIWGKMVATSLLAVLIYAACMPFMTLSFLLRGVDLPTIGFTLFFGFLATLACIQLGVFAATVTTSRGFRVLIAMGLLGFLGLTIFTLIGGLTQMIAFGGFNELNDAEFWITMTIVVLLFLGVVALLYSFSVAMISPPTANRAWPVRLTMLGVVGVMYVALAAWLIIDEVFSPSGTDDAEIFIAMWAVIATLLACLQIFIAICEREKPGARVARHIPRNPLLRIGAFCFYSGAGGGLVFAGVLAAVSLGVAVMTKIAIDITSSDLDEVITVCIGLVLYAYCYGITGLLIRRYLLGNVVRPEHTWSISLVLAAMALVLPYFFAFLMSGGGSTYASRHIWMLPNPLSLTYDGDGSLRYSALTFAGVWAVLMTILSIPWWVGVIGAFKPAKPEAMPDRPLSAEAEAVLDA